MNALRNTQVCLGLALFTVGCLMEAEAALVFLFPASALFLSAPPVLLHVIASLLMAGGASLVATARLPLRQAAGLAVLFAVLALVLPLLGAPVLVALTIILAWHSWRPIPVRVAVEEIPDTAGRNPGNCPVTAPLAGLLRRLPARDLQTALLGMAKMPPLHTRPLLKALQKHPDVRVVLYANGLLNDHLNSFEKHTGALLEAASLRPDDALNFTSLAETYCSLITQRIIPADEAAATARLALHSAGDALALDPANAPALAAKARLELILSDFPAAYDTIRRLYELPEQFATARSLHAELLFEFAASRPVRSLRHVPPSAHAVRQAHASLN